MNKNNPDSTIEKIPALVFGASSDEGRAVIEGLVESVRYDPVYAFTRHSGNKYLGATVFPGDIQNQDDVRNALVETGAGAIYLLTTTNLGSEAPETTASGFGDAVMEEYETLQQFAHVLKEVVADSSDKDDGEMSTRHLIVSTRDDVQSINKQYKQETGKTWISPMDDGSVVPHYSAKGRGAQYAMEYLANDSKVAVTLLTIPFLYSNFLGFFCPLPADDPKTQWHLTACLGEDGSQKIDMMGARDLKYIVPRILSDPALFNSKNLRLVGQSISMDEIAAEFADLFGKDVIFNPLTLSEMAALPFSAAPAIAQMCEYLASDKSPKGNLNLSKALLAPKQPQSFQDWLLVHSDSPAFESVGLDWDGANISFVTVFGATSKEGISVVKGLLADTRKQYRIRATTRNVDSPEAQALLKLAPEGRNIDLVEADYDDVESCKAAVNGVEGAFLVANLSSDKHVMASEYSHLQNVIDACDASHSIRHLVLASMMPPVASQKHRVRYHQWNDEGAIHKDTDVELPLDAKGMAVAYAHTKKISVTYLTLPYTEDTAESLSRFKASKKDKDKEFQHNEEVALLSLKEVGPIVADVFDSYQVYAGHELALVTQILGTSRVEDGSVDDMEHEVEVETIFLKDVGCVQCMLCPSRT